MLVDGLNDSLNNISSSYLKVGDDSMSEISFQTTAKGNLPHFSYMFRNQEPPGTEFTSVAYYITGSLLLIEVHIENEVTKKINYQKELGATTSCTKSITEATKGIGKKYIKGATKYFFFLAVSSPQRSREKL